MKMKEKERVHWVASSALHRLIYSLQLATPMPASHQPLEHESRSRCVDFLSSRTVDHSCRATLCSLKDYWLMWQLLTFVLFNLATILHEEFSIPHNKVMNVSSPRSDVWMGWGGIIMERVLRIAPLWVLLGDAWLVPSHQPPLPASVVAHTVPASSRPLAFTVCSTSSLQLLCFSCLFVYEWVCMCVLVHLCDLIICPFFYTKVLCEL